MQPTLCTALIGALLISGSASAGTASPPVPQQQALALEFRLMAGDQPVTCAGGPFLLGSPPVAVQLKDARFYIHDLALIRDDGTEAPVSLTQNAWQYLNVALIDLEDGQGSCIGNKERHGQVSGQVPAGHYTGLRFSVGVPVSATGPDWTPVALNHSNTEAMPPPLDSQAMGWNWQAGRKFMKIEVAPEGGVQRARDTVRIWTLHLGSTGCSGNPARDDAINCSAPNRVPVRLDNFDPSRDVVALDLAQLLGGSDLAHDKGGAAGCMSAPQDPECTGIFERLGLRLGPSRPGADDAGQPVAPTRIFRLLRDAP